MTQAEKLGQLWLALPPMSDEAIRDGSVGSMMNFAGPADVGHVQRMAMQSRLGLPLIVAIDVVHGYRTMFPLPIAEASTFDPKLAETASYWAAREASADGFNMTFGPMADVTRDVRWGRIVEGSGEDTFMASLFTKARIRGFHAGGLATTAKHFVGYGASIGGRDYDETPIPPAQLHDIYLPPFKAAVDAGTESIMAAFNALDGMPSNSNPDLLTGILRHQWGFKGFVMSDYAAIAETLNHGIAATPGEAARLALAAGNDVEMASALFKDDLPAEIAASRLDPAVLDEAARRVIATKIRMGLFDKPADPQPDPAIIPQARRKARAIAAESLVLLQNRDETLPVTKKVRRIAVVGPFADSARDQNGPHEAHGRTDETITLLQGIRERAKKDGIAVSYAAGCEPPGCPDDRGFDAAEEAARHSDLVVAVLGESRDLVGEGASRAHLDFPGKQAELLDRLAATGKPVVLVLMAGHPLTLGKVLPKTSAVLMTWYPGSEGGPAVADVLFGDVNPSGHLPYTWPRTVGQVPLFYNALPSGRPHQPGARFTLGYADEDLAPQFPFGFGLSYTQFAFSDLQVEPEFGVGDMVKVSVTVANTGKRVGKESVQLYVRDRVASRSRPLRELKALDKVELKPGEHRTVTLQVAARDLGFHKPDGTYVVEPGDFDVWVGDDSTAPLHGEFRLRDGLSEAPRT